MEPKRFTEALDVRHETRKDPKMTLKTLGLRNWKGWVAID